MIILSSSPGKVIFFGEHFVVKGKPAIATAINLRTQVILKPKDSWPSTIRSRPLNATLKINDDLSTSGNELLVHFVKALELLSEKGLKLKPFEADISGDLPPSTGLGSSASSAASFILALSEYLGYHIEKKDLFTLTNELEKVIHKNPSGIDSTIVVYGGTILYKRDEGFTRLNINRGKKFSLLIACTKSKRSTGELVQQVLEFARRHHRILNHVYNAAEALVKEAVESLENGDLTKLGELMNINQGLLYTIGVSSLELERIIFETRATGCLGSKLTGAGGGGCVIATCNNLKKAMLKLSPLTEKIFIADIDAPGAEVKLIK